MKIFRTFLVFLLVLAIAVICSCGDNAPKGSTETSSADTTETVSTTEPSVIMNIIENGTTKYRVVRSNKATDEVIQAAVDLKNAINDTYGIQIEIKNDFEIEVTDPSERYEYEILVGDTNRDESVSAKEMLKYNDFIISMHGTRIVISGGNDGAVVEAVKYFIQHYVNGDSLAFESNFVDLQKGAYKPITIEGLAISDYTVVYSETSESIAKVFAHKIGELFGAEMNLAKDTGAASEHEIVIGSTMRSGDDGSFGADDFIVSAKEGSIHISGGSQYALAMGCEHLINKLKNEEKNEFEITELSLSYTLPDRNEYINDISKLALHWNLYFDTPEWMLDFDEKYAAFMDTDGRLMSAFHRGDMVNYPENSIEGIISAIMLGGDMVEIDPRLTKDGVFVLLHDATLTRTTNVDSMKGKNGLPDSVKLSDWTYEQLMQLNLKEGTGGKNANLTPYKIPTLEEAIKVCANRVFIRLDRKGDDTVSCFWTYERDIWPLLQKYNAYSNVIYTWHAAFSANGYNIPSKYRALSEAAGAKPAPIILSANSFDEVKWVADRYSFNYGWRLGLELGDSLEETLKDNAKLIASFKGKVRVHNDAGFAGESYEYYSDLYDAGINIPLVNNGYLMCKYIAETSTPTEYSN